MESFFGDERVRKAGVAVLLVLALFLAAATVGEVLGFRYLGPSGQILNTITVEGKGEVFAAPDIATFTFTVMEMKQTPAAAQEAATRKINDGIALLKEKDIEEKDIKTLSYNIYPEYEWQNAPCPLGSSFCPGGKQVLKGYQVNQTVQVKVRDTNKVGELLAGIGSLGIQNISGIEFTLDEEEAIKGEARAKAIAEAKEKAQILAKELGVRLVRVTNFYENDGPVYPIYGRGGDAFDVAESKAVPAPQVPSGENKFTSIVTVIYEIR